MKMENVLTFSAEPFGCLPIIDFKPDIIHLNDWQTGMVSLLLDAQYRSMGSGFYKEYIHCLPYTI